jgi:hypothetical protein
MEWCIKQKNYPKISIRYIIIVIKCNTHQSGCTSFYVKVLRRHVKFRVALVYCKLNVSMGIQRVRGPTIWGKPKCLQF